MTDIPTIGSPRYVRFTTFRRSGEPVSVPVWMAPYGDEWVFGTDPQSGKIKRLSRNPNVEIAACNVRGRVKPGTAVYRGTARILDMSERPRAIEAVDKKYGYQWRFFALWFKVRSWFGRSFDSPYIAFKLHEVVRVE